MCLRVPADMLTATNRFIKKLVFEKDEKQVGQAIEKVERGISAPCNGHFQRADFSPHKTDPFDCTKSINVQCCHTRCTWCDNTYVEMIIQAC
eukprot:COSAG02_NODE_6585_length_3476_cov_2.822328_1_plen_92_part_00